ncbi:MAG: hypothetical protein RMI91_15335 [Gemmatales bacterium]|nr:hypothetical protein [Gemmatales bacterium]
MPAFRIRDWRAGLLAQLPDPGTPFGLDLSKMQITDAGLKELATLKNLTVLDLTNTQISDAGLKELTQGANSIEKAH